jgi:hypothetical protein
VAWGLTHTLFTRLDGFPFSTCFRFLHSNDGDSTIAKKKKKIPNTPYPKGLDIAAYSIDEKKHVAFFRSLRH